MSQIPTPPREAGPLGQSLGPSAAAMHLHAKLERLCYVDRSAGMESLYIRTPYAFHEIDQAIAAAVAEATREARRDALMEEMCHIPADVNSVRWAKRAQAAEEKLAIEKRKNNELMAKLSRMCSDA